jgi:PAS domain-containing protein
LQNANRALQAENAERRRAEELLRESEQRFRPLIERSSDAAIMFESERRSSMLAGRANGGRLWATAKQPRDAIFVEPGGCFLAAHVTGG